MAILGQWIWMFQSPFKKMYLFIFREKGREGEKEGKKHRSVVGIEPATFSFCETTPNPLSHAGQGSELLIHMPNGSPKGLCQLTLQQLWMKISISVRFSSRSLCLCCLPPPGRTRQIYQPILCSVKKRILVSEISFKWLLGEKVDIFLW